MSKRTDGPKKRGKLGRAASAVLWTGAMVAALLMADRFFLGPPVKTGWREALRLGEIPPEAGIIVSPEFMPMSLTWPPARIYFRTAPEPGWWLQLNDRDTGEVMLWMGSGELPVPTVMQPYAGCLGPQERNFCPDGWHGFSTDVTDERGSRHQPVAIVTRIDRAEAARIITHLRFLKR